MNQLESFDADQLAEEISASVAALPDSTVTSLRRIRREVSKRIATADAHSVIRLALALIEKPGLRWVAYELINQHQAAGNHLNAETLRQLGQGIESWDTVDPFSVYLVGPAWRKRQVPDSLIHAWAQSDNRWWRRTALASTVALNNKARGGSGDVPRTLQVCRLLADDPDDMVVKALSWALRELVKHDAGAVAQFLGEYDSVLATRIKREVRNKLSTGLKNPRRN